MSSEMPVTLMPWSANLWWARSKFSEDSSRAFEGMQPTLRHVPPRLGLPCAFFHASMHTTLRPSCAARMAAT